MRVTLSRVKGKSTNEIADTFHVHPVSISQERPKGATHWSTRAVARRIGISHTTEEVQEYLNSRKGRVNIWNNTGKEFISQTLPLYYVEDRGSFGRWIGGRVQFRGDP